MNHEPVSEILFRSLEELELPVRTYNAIQNANFVYLGDLVQLTERELLATKIMGRKDLIEIKAILMDLGLVLGMKIDNWQALKERWQAQQDQSLATY
jgi:DNA-directed RNA polymerase subunit alpha